MPHKTCCAATGIKAKMSTIEGPLGRLISLPILLLCAIIALAIISRIIRLISPSPQTIKIRRKFRRIFCTCCEWVLGMREHSFPKVFPYFFPLAVFTLRAIWYIRYILKTDLNLMIPDVVVWQLMDRVKQIRIPHPLPKNADTHWGICIFYCSG
jgi:hypothetical protein